MYKTVLVKQLIEDGATLLKRLDNSGFPIHAAAWFYDPEKSSWKLVIATSVADNPGPLEAYMKIQLALNGRDLSLSLDDITVMSASSRKFGEFKRTMEGVAGGALLSKSSADGVTFDDAYVYRWLE